MLVDNRAAPPAMGALTYAGFNLTMTIGRFAGGAIIQRFGRVPVLYAAGAIASAGVAMLCLVPSTVVALIGAAAWGLGLSVVFPSAMSAAGEVPGRGGRAIAVVSTIGYGGFLLGAPSDRFPRPPHASRPGAACCGSAGASCGHPSPGCPRAPTAPGAGSGVALPKQQFPRPFEEHRRHHWPPDGPLYCRTDSRQTRRSGRSPGTRPRFRFHRARTLRPNRCHGRDAPAIGAKTTRGDLDFRTVRGMPRRVRSGLLETFLGWSHDHRIPDCDFSLEHLFGDPASRLWRPRSGPAVSYRSSSASAALDSLDVPVRAKGCR